MNTLRLLQVAATADKAWGDGRHGEAGLDKEQHALAEAPHSQGKRRRVRTSASFPVGGGGGGAPLEVPEGRVRRPTLIPACRLAGLLPPSLRLASLSLSRLGLTPPSSRAPLARRGFRETRQARKVARRAREQANERPKGRAGEKEREEVPRDTVHRGPEADSKAEAAATGPEDRNREGEHRSATSSPFSHQGAPLRSLPGCFLLSSDLGLRRDLATDTSLSASSPSPPYDTNNNKIQNRRRKQQSWT